MEWYLHLLAFDKLLMVALVVAALATFWYMNRKHGEGKW